MKMSSDGKFLRRYTDLTALFYILKTRTLTLLNPQKWEDNNDSYYLDLYKKHKHLKSLLALCFTAAPERYHLWQVFGARESGVRIRFKRRDLLKEIGRCPELRAEPVDYVKLDKIQNLTRSIDKFPFLKRIGFQDEKEFRIIYESCTEKKEKIDIPISLSCIDKIVLSPWLHPDVFSQTKEVLLSIEGCDALTILHSRLTKCVFQ
jgi:hypothetical protein